RVATNVDFAANSLGASLGAVLGAASARRLIDIGWYARWGEHIFLPRTHAAAVLAAGWVFAQTPPQAMLFGTGDVVSMIAGQVLRLETLLPAWVVASPAARIQAEQWCTALAVVAI